MERLNKKQREIVEMFRQGLSVKRDCQEALYF